MNETVVTSKLCPTVFAVIATYYKFTAAIVSRVFYFEVLIHYGRPME